MDYVTEQANHLRRLCEESRAKQSAQHVTPAQSTQLDYRANLNKWWNNLAPSVRQHPWSMDTIMTAAFPGDTPAPRIIAAELRMMGFTEKRDWTRAGRNRRQWVPPAIDNQSPQLKET
jgi:hypothetical protein